MNSDITAKRQENFAGIANTPLADKVQKEDLR